MALLKRTSDFLASYKLSCFLFLLLLLLTYLGTMNQVENGLYQSQLKYFESIFLVHWAFGVIPIPLPGGYLVMSLTFVNLFWGAVVRLRRSWRKVGILVAHLGILLLLGGAFVSYACSESGHMVLYENETSDQFEASYEWEIGIGEAVNAASVTEYIIRQADFDRLSGNRSRTFKFSGLPFDLKLGGYMPNAAPDMGKGQGLHAAGRLVEVPLSREQEENMAGATVTLVEKKSGASHEAELWAGNSAPVTLDADGKRWNLSLRKHRWKLPFAIRLDKFDRELHPRTNMAAKYSSFVTKIEDGAEQKVRITMNEPLRHLGYTFYQSSWGPQKGGADARLYSVLAVVKNPADQVPLYACLVTTGGLILHFLQRLLAYLRKEKATKS